MKKYIFQKYLKKNMLNIFSLLKYLIFIYNLKVC